MFNEAKGKQWHPGPIAAKKKLWVGSLQVGFKPDGRPDRRKRKAKSQAECLKKLNQLKG